MSLPEIHANQPNSLAGCQMSHARQDSPASSTANTSPAALKLRKATQDFEGMLISSWWEEMQKSVRGSDSDSEPGSDTMMSVGFQAVGTAMAASGGLGIARTLYRQLEPALQRIHTTGLETYPAGGIAD